MFESLDLTPLTDAEIDEASQSSAGKPAVYRKPINAVLDKAGDASGSLAIPYALINPDAKTRATVLMGMRNAIKKHDAAKARGMSVKANTDETLVTVYVRAAV